MRAKIPDNFDWKYYIEHNPDVVKRYNIVDEHTAIKHWKIRGYKEDRPYRDNTILIESTSSGETSSISVPLCEGRIVVYSAIAGGYDNLRDIPKKETDVDYICFTDLNIQSRTWDIRPLPLYLKELPSTKAARCIKTLPYHFLPDYEVSVWVDGNIEVLGRIREFVSIQLQDGVELATSYHPDRTCVYDEADAVIRFGKDTPEEVERQIEAYKREGMPTGLGLAQTGIIVRKHLSEGCKKFCKQWWEEILDKSKRDQLSFPYVLWKNPETRIRFFNPNVMVSNYFQIWGHKGISPVSLPNGYGNIQNYINGKEI